MLLDNLHGVFWIEVNVPPGLQPLSTEVKPESAMSGNLSLQARCHLLSVLLVRRVHVDILPKLLLAICPRPRGPKVPL